MNHELQLQLNTRIIYRYVYISLTNFFYTYLVLCAKCISDPHGQGLGIPRQMPSLGQEAFFIISVLSCVQYIKLIAELQ